MYSIYTVDTSGMVIFVLLGIEGTWDTYGTALAEGSARNYLMHKNAEKNGSVCLLLTNMPRRTLCFIVLYHCIILYLVIIDAAMIRSLFVAHANRYV
jgi:hypothetical protein